MPTATVNLSVEQYNAIDAEAKKREVSFSRVVRERLGRKPKFPDDHKCPEAKPCDRQHTDDFWSTWPFKVGDERISNAGKRSFRLVRTK